MQPAVSALLLGLFVGAHAVKHIGGHHQLVNHSAGFTFPASGNKTHSGNNTDLCSQEPETGPCRAAMPKWFYNKTSKSCEKFLYGGCSLTSNVFNNKHECNIKCRDPVYGGCANFNKSITCLSYPQAKVSFNPEKQFCEWYIDFCHADGNTFSTTEACYSHCGEFVANPCILPINPGTETHCHNKSVLVRYGYNPKRGTCEKFNSSTCIKNKNSFASRLECFKTCAPNSKCLLHTQYHLYRFFTSYFYDFAHDSCNETKTFFRKSYWPDQNRFPTLEQCKVKCMPDYSPKRPNSRRLMPQHPSSF